MLLETQERGLIEVVTGLLTSCRRFAELRKPPLNVNPQTTRSGLENRMPKPKFADSAIVSVLDRCEPTSFRR